MAHDIDMNEHFARTKPDRGILSETLFKNEHTSLVVMHLAPGEELNEHTSKFPVWIQTLEGDGKLKTPDEEYEMTPGGWIYLEPAEEHAVFPTSDEVLRFALIIMKKQ